MYLLDTNICIFAIKRKPAHVLEAIERRVREGLYLSSLTIAELQFGVENSKRIEANRIALLKFISVFTIVSFQNADASHYGKLKAKLKSEGRIIGPIDMLLAAQALRNNLVLVTNNVGEFSRVEGLRVEDWSIGD